MTAITCGTEIARSPEDVFAYLDQVERHKEWQTQIVSAKKETDGPVGVGTTVSEVRRVPFAGKQSFRWEITEHDPPRRVSFRVVNGPVRPFGTVTLEPAVDGRTRINLTLDFVGHGIGKLFAPLARKDARKQSPADMQRLKERLEGGA